MAQKKSSEPKVTRISASDKKAPAKSTASSKKPQTKKVAARPKAASKAKATTKIKSTKAEVSEKANPSVIRRIGGYFKGAWYELSQVRWPNRRTTWGLTLAVLIFSAFFVGLVILLDTVFGKLFNLVIG